MSETHFPPPRPAGSPLTTAQTAPPLLRDALVVEAPPKLSQPADTLLLSGKVIGNNRAKGEIKIATPDGTLTVQSKIAIPPDTEVTVELKMQQLSLRANITVIKQKAAETAAAADMVKPAVPPPTATASEQPAKIIPGAIYTALRLPPETPAQPPATQPAPQTGIPSATGETTTAAPQAQPPAPAALTLENAAKIIESARKIGVAQLPATLPELPPIPIPILWQILNTRDVLSALQKLPPQMQQQITAFLQQPVVINALEKIIPPAELATYYPPAPTSAPAEAPVTDTTPLVTRPQSAMAPPAAPPQSQNPLAAQTAVLRGIMPLLEAMLPGVAGAIPMGAPPPAAKTAIAAPLPQNMVKVEIVSVFNPPPRGDIPQPPIPSMTQNLPAGAQLATVESLTPKGFPILALPDGHIVLQQPVDVPVGTQMAVALMQMSLADVMALSPLLTTAGGPPLSFDPLQSRTWPALQETLQVLVDQSSNAAQLLKNTLPAPVAARMTPTALFFLAALRVGSIESWLGENILQALNKAGRKDLIERLSGDFKSLSRQAQNTIGGDWRVISLPMLHDEQISQIQFYVRRQQDDDQDRAEDGETRKITRFILNLTLSRMGDMQMDGLIRQKRLDLILRSESALPFDIRQEIMQRFAAGIEQVNMQGKVSFQTRAEKWAHIDTGSGDSRSI